MKDMKQNSHVAKITNHIFSLRVVNYWNALPDNIVEASTTNTFKNRLDKFYGDIKYKIDFPVPTPEPQH